MAWTVEEDQILKELYEKAPRETILLKLPGRNWKSAYKRSIILGLYRPKDDAWKEEEDNLLKEIYPNNPQEFIEANFPGRTWKALSWRANNIFRLVRSEEIIQEKNRLTNQKHRGTDYPTQSADVREKVKTTVREKYGVDNVFQAEEIKKKLVQTNLEKYGVGNPNQCPEIRQKTELTVIKKYGVKNPFQMDRVQQGMKKKYGETSPLRVPEIKERQQQTNIKKYGGKTPAENPEVQKKIETTNITRYGFKTPFLSPIVKQMIRETNLKRYGVTNPAQVEEIKRKIQETTFQKYGVRSFLEIKEIREKGYTVRKGRKSIHKSKEEIVFLDYLRILDPATEPHIEHPVIKNVIDYYMPKFDLWVQYDGTYWHGKIKRYNVTRQSLKIQRTIKRDQYQNEHIPNLIRFWSDDAQEAIKNDSILDLIENKIVEKTYFSHQYLKKIESLQEDLKNLEFDPEKISASDFILSPENISPEIIEFIVRYEWLGTIGVMPKWCFTARYQGKLGGVVFINEPTSYSQLLGGVTRNYEALIQRGATASWSPKNLGSRLVMFSCNWMIENTEKRLFVGYTDPMANELGTIYQACNFDYLGNNFGVAYLFKHPQIKNGKWFSVQTLKRTSSFKKWCSKNNILVLASWFKDNGFKDLKIIPEEIKRKWYDWNRQIIKEAEKLKVDKKHKYALIIGKTKEEKKNFISLRTYTPQIYPKRLTTDN